MPLLPFPELYQPPAASASPISAPAHRDFLTFRFYTFNVARSATKTTTAKGKPKRGSKVVLASLPPGLLRGLPEEDQEAIRAIVGKPVLLAGYDEDGRAELTFTEASQTIHSIFVNPKRIKPFRKSG